jgi:hypothetical protein
MGKIDNSNIGILASLLTATLIIGLLLGAKRGGWNRHLCYMWTLVVFTPYCLITPLYFYNHGTEYVVGTYIWEYYATGFFMSWLAIFCFIVGYWIRNGSPSTYWLAPPKTKINNPEKLITILFIGLYGIVLTNLAIGGTNVTDLFLGNSIAGLGAEGGSYYLQNFADSLITVLVLAYFFELPKKKLLVFIGLSFFLFSLLGFRYRIMLSLFGLFFVYLYKNKLNFKYLVVSLFLGVIMMYAILFSTANRYIMISKQYEKLKYDPADFDYEGVFDQTRGALPDMAVYRLYDNPAKQTSYDYGVTTFLYPFVRMVPRFIYPNKDDLYPPPQLATTVQAYDSIWGKFTGEATLSNGALYIAGGSLGIIIGCFLWGGLVRKFANKRRVKDKLSLTVYIVIALVTFQWITRGYFPQEVDHAVYMLAPIWFLKWRSNKIAQNAHRTHRRQYTAG